MKMYIYVHMPSVFFFFSFFVAEASPSVQFVTASLGNVVMEKKTRKKKNLYNNVLTVAQSKTNCHSVVFNMDFV